MGIALSAVALLVASVACALSLAVALRVKKILDPWVAERVAGGPPPFSPLPGTVVPAVPALTDADGTAVELPLGDGAPWVLTFQSAECDGCKEQLPVLKEFLAETGVAESRVFSVIGGDASGTDFYRSELNGLSRIFPEGGTAAELKKELGVVIFPTYIVVDGGGTVAVATADSGRLMEAGGGVLAPVAVGG
ncbi:TlpA family protein disulfide reductase [Streptomyces tsukubensis]|uniref:TlpA family protein disulfide reductase n=1 Tax=Streptomyces tsukubensis TaxID=83656 RepID=UPI0036CB2925